ncbi:MAG: ESX secretion-associated protein EspG [Labedaea sp.]
MSGRNGFDASLDVVEMDLLCTFAGVAAPFPLQVPSSGASDVERRANFRAARERLTSRGLADDRGPRRVAATFVHLLASSPAALDLTLAIGTGRLGATLLAFRGEALLAVSELDRDEPVVGMVELQIDDAVDELLRLIPELDAALTTPFTVPRRALAEVNRVLVARARTGRMGSHELDELLGAHGIDERLARRMSMQLQPVLGNGQVGLAECRGYAREWRRVGQELRWLDTDSGRFQLGGTAEWMSVNPLFAGELYAAIRRLAAALG